MCKKCDWEEYIKKCDEVLANDNMEWCHEFVDSVKEWAEDNTHITEKQAEVIDKHFTRLQDEDYY